jgi:hypothetical protein
MVNGDKVLEESKGDYYPWWLKNLVTAMFDPIPMADMLKQVNSTLPKPHGDARSQSCSRMSTNDLGYLVFCFRGDGLAESVLTPWFRANYKDYEGFAGKHVARHIVMHRTGYHH